MSTVERPALSGITTLVIDDHHDSVQLLIAALEPFGAVVLAAGSAPEARTLLSATDVDIIVCDLGLPGENGLEFIRWVRARATGHDVPAIAVTFFSERFGVREARAAGFDVFLRKPIDPTDIVHVVASLVNRQRPPANEVGYPPRRPGIPKPALPVELPPDPMPLLDGWLKEAFAEIRNAHAMTLATVDPEGRPTARMVICRGIDVRAGWIVFYTDRESAKGTALDANPYAALVFNWDAHERQARVEGPVTFAPDSDSDAYWNSRPRDARAAAAASNQSRPIESRAAFLAKVEQEAQRGGDDIPRPKRWGGYRVWAERVELWAGQPARAHDRALWSRALTPQGDGFSGGAWRSTRLQP